MGSLAKKANPSIGLDPTIPGWSEQVGTMLNNLLIGKLNNTGTFTLVHGGVSTTVSDARCGPNSIINVMATTADSGIALSDHWISTRTNGSFTISHASTSTSVCTASYTLLG